jgi:hypothetical protein
MIPRVEHALEQINKKLDDNFIGRREYDKHLQLQEESNEALKKELDIIRDTMVTKEEYQRSNHSQFWQKFMTYLGGIGSAALLAIVIYEVTRLITK